MRLRDRSDTRAGQFRERFLGPADTAVHQLVPTEHDDEIVAVPDQAQFAFAARDLRRIDQYAGKHAAPFRAIYAIIGIAQLALYPCCRIVLAENRFPLFRTMLSPAKRARGAATGITRYFFRFLRAA
jgi:hypothetical protein